MSDTKFSLRAFWHSSVQSALGLKPSDESINHFGPIWGRRFSGVWLFIMYGVVFYIVIMSLTAYQIQTRIQTLGENSQKLSIWGVTRSADRIYNLQNRIDNAIGRKSILESQLLEANYRYDEITNEIIGAQEQLIPEIEILGADINLTAVEDYTKIKQFAQSLKSQLLKTDTGKSALLRFETANSQFQEASSRLNRITRDLDSLSPQLEILQIELKDTKNSISDHQKIVELTDELRFFYYPPGYTNTSWIGGIYAYMFGGSDTDSNNASYGFVTLPSEVLIILIVIAMGTMGSLINITQVYFTGEERKVTFFLFRPMLGAVVAIGIYVITKAGVLVSSNVAADTGGVTKLNAFFVSFISLISGLMSDIAIKTLKQAGNRFLRGDQVTEHARYAMGVKDVLEAKGMQWDHIYQYFDVSPEIVDKWLAETEPVPGNAQLVIAAWLDKPVRNIFSDLRPGKQTDGASRVKPVEQPELNSTPDSKTEGEPDVGAEENPAESAADKPDEPATKPDE